MRSRPPLVTMLRTRHGQPTAGGGLAKKVEEETTELPRRVERDHAGGDGPVQSDGSEGDWAGSRAASRVAAHPPAASRTLSSRKRLHLFDHQ